MEVKRRGRRPGRSGAREEIAEAARHQFAELGYDRTTIRSVAAEAGVDPALVIHYFESKQRLFVQAVELPFPPEGLTAQLASGPRSQIGERVVRFVLSVLADDEARVRWIGLIRSAVSEPEATRVFREILSTRIFRPIAEELGADEAPLRASLAGSQVVGLVMARHIVHIEPLASLEEERLVQAIAPTIQRYLAGPL